MLAVYTEIEFAFAALYIVLASSTIASTISYLKASILQTMREFHLPQQKFKTGIPKFEGFMGATVCALGTFARHSYVVEFVPHRMFLVSSRNVTDGLLWIFLLMVAVNPYVRSLRSDEVLSSNLSSSRSPCKMHVRDLIEHYARQR